MDRLFKCFWKILKEEKEGIQLLFEDKFKE